MAHDSKAYGRGQEHLAPTPTGSCKDSAEREKGSGTGGKERTRPDAGGACR